MAVKGPKRTQKDPAATKWANAGNHHFKALKHTAGKHANVPNGDEIGIVRPLKHSQRGPTRVLPAFGAKKYQGGSFWEARSSQ
jgi:hypothetical protein